MGIFQRAHDIVQAKTNKALDAAEKPDEMLDLSYEKMLEQITQVRRALVDIAASKKQLELQEQQFQHTIDHLQDQAKQALQANREDLAKEALSRKAAAQQQIDQMEPQRQQLDEEEQKLTQTLDVLQKRVNDFRTQKETLKAQYTAAKAISSVDESTAGISKSFNDSGAALQRAQDKIATMQARSGALDELLESGVLEDVGGGTDDIQKELDQVGKDAQVDNELAALKAQLGTGRTGARRDRAAPARQRRPRRPKRRRRPRSHTRGVAPIERGHDVGQLGAAVLLEEVARAGDRHVRRPARRRALAPAAPRPSPGAGVTVGEGREERALERPQGVERAPVLASAGAAGREAHEEGQLARTGAVRLVGERGVVGRQDRVRHLRRGGPLHEEAGPERRELLGQPLVVEQGLRHGDRAVTGVVDRPGQAAGQGRRRRCAAPCWRPRRGGRDPGRRASDAQPDGPAPVLHDERDAGQAGRRRRTGSSSRRGPARCGRSGPAACRSGRSRRGRGRRRAARGPTRRSITVR